MLKLFFAPHILLDLLSISSVLYFCNFIQVVCDATTNVIISLTIITIGVFPV